MIQGFFFIFFRVMEVIFLIPIIGMMAYFVNGFVGNNQLTPDYILILFIVSVIAIFWAFDTMIRYSTTKRSAAFISFVDFGFFGALIAGIYKLNFISNADCTNWEGGSVLLSLGPFGLVQGNNLRPDINKTCGMLKSCFAIGIMEVFFFFCTAVAAVYMRGPRDVVVKETFVRRRSHSSRRGHGSHHSRRGSSSRRSYA